MEEARPVRRRTRYVIALGGVLVVLAGIAALLWWPNKSPQKTGPIPPSIKAQVSFPVYYPEESSDWSIDPQSFQTDQGVLLYVIKSPAGDINISQQAKPANFDFKKFHHQVLTGGTLIMTATGNGAIGNADGKLIGSLVAEDKTWIIATPSSDAVTQTQLTKLFNSLRTD